MKIVVINGQNHKGRHFGQFCSEKHEMVHKHSESVGKSEQK